MAEGVWVMEADLVGSREVREEGAREVEAEAAVMVEVAEVGDWAVAVHELNRWSKQEIQV